MYRACMGWFSTELNVTVSKHSLTDGRTEVLLSNDVTAYLKEHK